MYSQAIDRSPRMPSLWIEWANVDAERRRFSEAVVKLDRARTLDENRPDAWLLRGHVHALQRDAARALVAYDRALSLRPQDVAATRGRAIALASLMRWDEALTAVTDALALAPDDPTSTRLRTELMSNPLQERNTARYLDSILSWGRTLPGVAVLRMVNLRGSASPHRPTYVGRVPRSGPAVGL